MNSPADFRRRLATGAPLIGSFIKTPTPHATEIFADLGYDFVVIDEEHGPFDRASLDMLMLATTAKNIAGIVRVSGQGSILAALDMGASGILMPHINTAQEAEAVVAACRYIGGERGCSPSPRAGGYGAIGLAEHVARADAKVAVAVMIEHPQAVANIDEIARIEGVDALFLGLGDLAVASNELVPGSPAIRAMAEKICASAKRHGKTLMSTAATIEAAQWLMDLGVSALVVSSDQGLMRAAAAGQRQAFLSLAGGHESAK